MTESATPFRGPAIAFFTKPSATRSRPSSSPYLSQVLISVVMTPRGRKNEPICSKVVDTLPELRDGSKVEVLDIEVVQESLRSQKLADRPPHPQLQNFEPEGTRIPAKSQATPSLRPPPSPPPRNTLRPWPPASRSFRSLACLQAHKKDINTQPGRLDSWE